MLENLKLNISDQALDSRTHIEKIIHGSKLNQLQDNHLVQIISCQGIKDFFDLSSLTMHEEYRLLTSSFDGSYYLEREEIIKDKKGNEFNLSFVRDARNVSISIKKPDTKQPVLKVNFRDRSDDGTEYATPPIYQGFGNISTNPSEHYNYIGQTGWFYSGPYDILPAERCAVEISILSSNPEYPLNNIGYSLKEIEFIDDPFAFIPFDNPTPDNLNTWYNMWWDIVNRGLNGNQLPQPGQTSERGFNGFLDHVISSIKEPLKALGYTHLSAVPSWKYVWHMFKDRGFNPDHEDLYERTNIFFQRLSNIEFPHPQRRDNTIRFSDLSNKDPLLSWFALLPFVIKLNKNFTPTVNKDNLIFQTIINQARKAFIYDNKVYSYPLKPDRNLWLSIPL